MNTDELAEFIAGLPDDTELWGKVCSREHCKYADGEMCLERNAQRDCKTAVKHFLLSEAEV